ncbi:MAG: hypothetical protein R2854_24220 [Caldilineaceae bacterium]
MKFSNVKRNLLIGAAALTVAGGVAVAGASLAPQIVSAAPAAIAGVTAPGGPRGDLMGRGGDHGQYLADALGITVEDLQAAMDSARDAVQPEDGTAPEFGRQRDHDAIRGTMDAALAEALGISVDDLQAAQQEARDAALADAVANGDITQEQADLMRAGEAVKEYMDREALTAAALGMTVEELQAAREEGVTMADLLAQQGLDRTTFADALQAEADKALAQAVSDGVITQEQADQLAEMGGRFMDGGPGGHGERGGRHGHGDEGGRPERGPDGQDQFQRGPRGGEDNGAPQDGTSGNGVPNFGSSQL